MSDDPTTPPRWQIVLGIEAVLLLMALVMPVTPSKTGSQWSPSESFFGGASYPIDVLVYFVFGNVMLGLIAVALIATNRS